MVDSLSEKQRVLDAIRQAAQALGHPPSRAEFKARSGMTEYQVLRHFPSWREAVRAAGLDPNRTNIRLEDRVLLQDWGELVRKHRQIPTRQQYRREGKYSPGVFESHFGPWSTVPGRFREFAGGQAEWADVLALLPVPSHTRDMDGGTVSAGVVAPNQNALSADVTRRRYPRLEDRPIYGNPVDFRGLRHEPVNEQGVVFLFHGRKGARIHG